MEQRLIDNINSPKDLKALSVKQLPQVCSELRQMLVDELSRNPGHLASSLGTIELTVALHYVYDLPQDKIVWDVGHQAYAHKILSGRRNRFKTNRMFGGLKPFPSPSESEYDAFTAGHASNSISAGLGMSVAECMLNGDNQHRIVSVIGDGAMSGGLAFEGLNNVSSCHSNMLIILNDNNMSISRSVGGMRTYLTHLQTSKQYNSLRYLGARFLTALGLLTEEKRKRLIRFNNKIKMRLLRQQNMFEGMDIRYFGIIDGHDVQNLVRVLTNIRDMKGPKMMHIRTVKGKGYEPAEKEASIWHAPGMFDTVTGKRIIKKKAGEAPLYQEVFGKTLVELMRSNPKIVGVTPAMPLGCSMDIAMREFPNRCFDVGIAEGHAVTFSAGMAIQGLTPFCNIYSSFLQRAYDNIIHDVAIERLNVVFCIDRAGIVGEDGPTHHGAFDLAYLRPIPNLIISAPYNEQELRNLMYTAQLPDQGPFVIRYPRGRGLESDYEAPFLPVTIGTGRKLRSGNDLAILSLGAIGNFANMAIERWEKSNPGKSIALYDMRFLKPIDETILHNVAENFKNVITLENGTKVGGLGSAVTEFMNNNGYRTKVHIMGLPDAFVEHGAVPLLLRKYGLDADGVIAQIDKILKS
ncbi:MAG: 1-deoxy-D-xylulose-5-phosphate synthase [Bacteroidaceae bacterium]|nr:1-deoxy-D-xylulose-5-phosphate synthase [Bacteroidaceae bacterium]